VEEFVKERL